MCVQQMAAAESPAEPACVRARARLCVFKAGSLSPLAAVWCHAAARAQCASAAAARILDQELLRLLHPVCV